MICPNCLKTYPKNHHFWEVLGIKTEVAFFTCRTCQEKFHYLEKNKCQGCARNCSDQYCSDCLKWQEVYPEKVSHEAIFTYDENFSQWMDDYKFKGAYHLRFTFQKELKKIFCNTKEVIVPIPISEKRLKERGFNQVEGLLEGAGISYVSLLEKSCEVTPQSKQGKKERMALPQVFRVKKDLKVTKPIILFDDVYTTGTTLVRAQEMLEKNGYKVVKTVSLAR